MAFQYISLAHSVITPNVDNVKAIIGILQGIATAKEKRDEAYEFLKLTVSSFLPKRQNESSAEPSTNPPKASSFIFGTSLDFKPKEVLSEAPEKKKAPPRSILRFLPTSTHEVALQ